MAFLRTDFRTLITVKDIMNSFVHSKTCTRITDELTDVARINFGHFEIMNIYKLNYVLPGYVKFYLRDLDMLIFVCFTWIC